MSEYQWTEITVSDNKRGTWYHSCDTCQMCVPVKRTGNDCLICEVCYKLQPAEGLAEMLAVVTNILRGDLGAFESNDTAELVVEVGEVLNGTH